METMETTDNVLVGALHILFISTVSISVILNILAILIFTSALFYGKLKLHIPPSPVLAAQLPGVSIIKPLYGTEKYLEENLRSFFTLEYPHYEVLFCVHDDNDLAAKAVKTLQHKFPSVSSRLFTGISCQEIKNPLVRNMVPAFEAAQYDTVWICTSRVKGRTDGLVDMLQKSTSQSVGLVHQIPYCSVAHSLAAQVEKIYFGCVAGKYYLAFHAAGLVCFTGMSYIVKKSNFLPDKSLPWFGQYMAEDFFMGHHFKNRGFAFKLSSFPAEQKTEVTFNSFLIRMIRWQKLRINMLPFSCGVLEILGTCFVHGILTAFTLYHVFDVMPAVAYCVHCFSWVVLDYALLHIMQGPVAPMAKVDFLKAWFICQCLQVYVHFCALKNLSRLQWGNSAFVLSNFGKSVTVYKSTIL